jgi:hypothetical protein
VEAGPAGADQFGAGPAGDVGPGPGDSGFMNCLDVSNSSRGWWCPTERLEVSASPGR